MQDERESGGEVRPKDGECENTRAKGAEPGPRPLNAQRNPFPATTQQFRAPRRRLRGDLRELRSAIMSNSVDAGRPCVL